MESAVSECEPSGMPKVGTRKMTAAEMRAATHAAEVRASSHAAAMHPAAAAMTTATAAASERRWRQSKRRTERTRDQATQELVVNPNFSVVEFFQRISSQEDPQQSERIQ